MGRAVRRFLLVSAFLLASAFLYGLDKGDVNEDGEVNIIDALLIAQYYVGLDPPGFNSSLADVNSDGSITIIDALLVAKFDVQLIASFP